MLDDQPAEPYRAPEVWSLVQDRLLDRLRDSHELRAITPGLEADVRAGTLTPGLAAQQLIAAFLPDPAIPGGG